MSKEHYDYPDIHSDIPVLVHHILMVAARETNGDEKLLRFLGEEIKNITAFQVEATLKMIRDYKPINYEDTTDTAIWFKISSANEPILKLKG